MSRPSIVKGGYLTILVGDGAAPEVFTILCGFSTRTFTEQVSTSDDYIPDCADPEDVPVRVLNVTGRQWDLSGDGRYNRAQAELLRGLVGVTKTYRFQVSEPTADNVDDGYYEGPAMITSRQIGATDGQNATSQISIASDGEWIWHDAA